MGEKPARNPSAGMIQIRFSGLVASTSQKGQKPSTPLRARP